MTAYSKYRRFGLRADQSLGDLPNSDQGLTNVLDDLVLNTNFTAFDLKVINGLRNTNLRKNDLAELKDQEQKYTPITISNGVVIAGQETAVAPVPTIENIIKNRKTILGEPPMYSGGNGPHARFLPTSAFGDFANTSNYLDETDPGIIDEGDFWLEGAFGFSGQINSNFTDNFGGVEWTGFFSIDEARYFSIKTNGFFEIAIENVAYDKIEGDWYIPFSNAPVHTAREGYIDSASFAAYAGTGKLTEIPINAYATDVSQNYSLDTYLNNLIFPGDIFTLSDDSQFRVLTVNWDVFPTSSAYALISVEHISGPTTSIDVNSTGFAVTIQSRQIGGDPFEVSFSLNATRSLDTTLTATSDIGCGIPISGFKNEKIKMRVRVWWMPPSYFDPEDDAENYPSKFATFDFGDLTPGIPAPYTYWYKELPDYEGREYSYQYFLNNKMSYSNIKTNTFLQSSKQIFSRYTPKPVDYDVMGSAGFYWVGKNHLTVTYDNGYPVEDWKQGDILIYTTSGNPPFANVYGAQRVSFVIYETKLIDGIWHVWTDPKQPDLADVFDWDPDQDKEGSIKRLQNTGSSFTMNVIDSNGVTGVFFMQSSTGTGTAGPITGSLVVADLDAGNGVSGINSDYNLEHIKKDDIIRHTGYANINKLGWRIVDLQPQSNTITGELLSVDFTAHPIDSTNYSTFTATGPVVIHSHRGLVDNSIDAQCTGVYGKEVKNFPKANAGATSIAVDSIEGIQVGDVVQFIGIIPRGTTVTSISGTYTDPDGITWHNINLSNPLDTDLPNAYTLILISTDYKQDYTPDGGASFEDKSFCVLPFNTAPPFLGTAFGLATSGDYPHLDVNGDLRFQEFEINSTTVNTVTDSATETGSVGILFHKEEDPDDDTQWNRFYLIGNPIP